MLLDELQDGVQPHPETEGFSWDVLLEEGATHAKNNLNVTLYTECNAGMNMNYGTFVLNGH